MGKRMKSEFQVLNAMRKAKRPVVLRFRLPNFAGSPSKAPTSPAVENLSEKLENASSPTIPAKPRSPKKPAKLSVSQSDSLLKKEEEENEKKKEEEEKVKLKKEQEDRKRKLEKERELEQEREREEAERERERERERARERDLERERERARQEEIEREKELKKEKAKQKSPSSQRRKSTVSKNVFIAYTALQDAERRLEEVKGESSNLTRDLATGDDKAEQFCAADDILVQGARDESEQARKRVEDL